MAHEKIKAIIVFIAVFAIVGGVSWALASTQPAAQDTEETALPPDTMPKLTIHEDIRTAAMTYIKENHPESSQFMNNLEWTGGRTTTEGLVGAETYTFTSNNGWNITIHYPVIPNPTYEVTANYASTGIGIPYAIAWSGTCTNWAIAESSYNFAQ